VQDEIGQATDGNAAFSRLNDVIGDLGRPAVHHQQIGPLCR
jgi:hypothetical protein